MNEASLTHPSTSVREDSPQRLSSRTQAHDNHTPRLAARRKQHEGGAAHVASRDIPPAPLGSTTLTDAMSDLVVTCDADGFVTYMNSALRAVPQRDEAGDSSSREAASGEQ